MAYLDMVKEWRDDAVEDGWSIEPTYGDHESVDRAATLKKDGFKAHVISRDENNATVSIWGPDNLAIEVPFPYNWQAIVDGMEVCSKCGSVGHTVRLGFAGRVCPACRKILAPRVEYPGWCN